jgi:peptide/nickel transport system ATP-binding protein
VAPPVVEVDALTLELPRDGGHGAVVRDLSLRIGAGEIVGLVGESGSGKSVTALSLLRLLPASKARYGAASRIVVLGRDVLAAPDATLRAMRGADVSMIFQEPMTALNPVLRIERQMVEVIRRHRAIGAAEARERSRALLADLQIADPARVLDSYPHELSGGMRQRVMIAMAFSCDPALIVADEATTALDVTVQAQILELLHRRVRERGTACLLITHDLAIVSRHCDRVYVMYRGAIVEQGAAADVIREPRHPYTRALLAALPGRAAPRSTLATVAAAMRGEGEALPAAEPGGAAGFAPAAAVRMPSVAAPAPPVERRDASAEPILALRRVSVRYPRRVDFLGRPVDEVAAVDDVSLEVRAGETLCLVGESGCGKSSLLNAIVGLVPHSGEVRYDGTDARALGARRREIQMVFQDPQGSLDPRWPAWKIVTEPAAAARTLGRAARRGLATGLFAKVDLEAGAIDRLPHEFSGGQRQRLAIARALSVEPRLLVLDEPTSALDVSVQAQVLNLLVELQDRERLAYLFVSHDMGVVRHIADRIAIMQRGRIVESGEAAGVLAQPQHPYTRTLLAAVPQL